MFIVHGAWLRKNARWFLAIILVILIPGFIALFTRTDSTSRQRGPLPTIGGKAIDQAEFENARTSVVAAQLISTGGRPRNTSDYQEQVVQRATIRVLLLREAKKYGITVSDQELVHHIRSQPFFLNQAGQFDPERFREFGIRLNQLGVPEVTFEQMMREDLVINRLRDLVTTGAKVTPLQSSQAYATLHEKVLVDYVEFDTADYKAPVALTDADLQVYFDKNKERYRLPRAVKVRYARLGVDAAAEKVSDQDVTEYFNRNSFRYTNTLEQAKEEIRTELARMRARRAANNRATEMTVELVAEPGVVVPDFAGLVGKYGGQLAETGFLAPGATAPESGVGPNFVTAALILSPSSPYSDPVEGTNAYYVLQFREAQETRLPTLAEAKDKVMADLKRDRIREAVLQQGRDAAAKVQDLVKGGKTFAAACAELKLNVKSAPPFTLTDEELAIPGSIAVKETALGLPTNAVSSFLPTAQGGLFFTVKERWPYDTTQFEKDKITFNQMLLRQNREALWDAWVGNLIRTMQVNFGERPTPPPAREAEAEPLELPVAPAAETPPPAAPAK